MRRIPLALLAALVPALADPIVIGIDTAGSGLQLSGDVVLRGARTSAFHIGVPLGDSLRVTLDNITVVDSNIYLDGPALSFSGKVHVLLKGRSTVVGGSRSSPPFTYISPRCAVTVGETEGSRLRIDAAPREAGEAVGSLWITGGGFYAGLCHGAVLSSGEVHATGGTGSPGVRTIRVEGGLLVAQGGTWCAGLEGPDIEIAGGKVVAIGGSSSAGIATSVETAAGAFFKSFTLRISGGEIDAIAGSSADGIGRQNSRYPKLDPCGRVEITGGFVRTWAESSSTWKVGRICGDSVRILGGTVLATLESRRTMVIKGGTLPYVHTSVLFPRWNGIDSTHVLRIGGLPREAAVDSLFLSTDPRYGIRELRTDSGGWLGVVVPAGPLQGFLRAQGKAWRFDTRVATTDANVVMLEPRTGILRGAPIGRLAVRVNSGRVVVEGSREGDPIRILDPEGRIHREARATGSRQELSPLSAGVYFLRCGAQMVRFVSGG